jgi:hypothetical protein
MIEELVAKAEIADVVHGYALAIRHRRYPDAAALFTAEGWFEIREGMPGTADTLVRTRLNGRDAVLDYLLAGADRAEQPIPMIHNLIVTLTGATTATASALMEAQLFPTPARMLGDYADALVREDGTWRFASRTYTIFRAGG